MTDLQLLGSIFQIRSPVNVGTCFLFGDKRHVLTAKHVVVTAAGRIAGDIVVDIESGKSKRASRCQVLGSYDIALVEFADELPGTPLEPTDVAGEPPPEVKFRAAGFPVDVSERWQPGKLVGRVKLGEYELRFDNLYTSQLSGLSGAPVLDLKGRVLGVISEHDAITPSAGKMVPLVDFQGELDFAGPTAAFTCLVIFSDSEPSADGILRTAVREAIDILRGTWDEKIDMILDYATDCVSSKDAYVNVVRHLCHADVCIFDLTGYEPAVMLLLGVRSVVKRSITIGSVAKGIESAPYDIKELNLLSHAQATSKGLRLRNVIAERIRAGRAAQSLQHYLDLPTFEAVRNLPPGRRSEIPPRELVLLLSSYSGDVEANLDYIQDRLQFELQKRNIEWPKISRVLDLNVQTPWLVSQNMYEAIRRTKLCIVDWTGFPGWSENVFFELGVRIAVRDSATFCILEDGGTAQGGTPGSDSGSRLTKQQQKLIDLFNPVRYRRADTTGQAFATMMMTWDNFAAGRGGDQEGPCEYTFREITAAIDVRQGLVARTVALDLLQSAQLLSADDTEALSGVLYPSNRELSTAAGTAVKERLWAAWYYMNERYTVTEMANDPDLLPLVKDIIRGLLAAVGPNDQQVKPVKETLIQLFGGGK